MDGRNEGMVGEALKGYRDRVYVATKVKPGSKEAMIRSIDESLSSLKVDYVDLLQLHALSSAEQVMNTEYREVLAEAKKSGKTRFIGVTTHSKEPDVERRDRRSRQAVRHRAGHVQLPETAGSQGRHCQRRRGQHRHHCNEDPGGRISDPELYHSKRGIQSQNSNRA